MKNIRTVSLRLLAAAVIFIGQEQPSSAQCARGQTATDLPFVSIGGYSGWLDVSKCGPSCAGSLPCYLADVTGLKYCKVTGTSESTYGCKPTTVSTTARQGQCNATPPGGQGYACGCGNLSPSTKVVTLATAEYCTP